MDITHRFMIVRNPAGVAALALCLLFADGLQSQTPESLVALNSYGSYGQQLPVKMEEPVHFSISPETQGDVLMARQRYVAALEAYRQCPMDSAVTWNKMGIANHHLFNLKEAQKDYEKAIKLNPGYPEALNNLGAVYYGQKNFKDAERAYKKAIRLDPHSAMFYSNLGTAYLAQGNQKKGAAAYKTALAMDPNVFDRDPSMKIVETGPTQEMAALNFLLAKTYAEAGRRAEAMLYLQRAFSEGFANRRRILEEKEFAVLYDMPEFQRLISERGN